MTLRIARLPYDHYATEAMAITLTTTDPSGVLDSVPTTATIPLGELYVDVPVDTTGITGQASILCEGPDDEEAEVLLVTRQQAIDIACWDTVYVPTSSSVLYVFNLEHPVAETQDWQYSVVPSDNSLSVSSYYPEGLVVRAGSRTGAFYVECGTLTGSFSVCIANGVLASATVDLHVVSQEFTASGSQITLTNMCDTDEGKLAVELPEGVVFDSAQGPSGFSTYMSITGVGTDVVLLEFEPSEPRPDTIQITITLDGDDPQVPLQLTVDDWVRDALPGQCFFVEIP